MLSKISAEKERLKFSISMKVQNQNYRYHMVSLKRVTMQWALQLPSWCSAMVKKTKLLGKETKPRRKFSCDAVKTHCVSLSSTPHAALIPTLQGN